MGYRDDRNVLRARIVILEAKLKERKLAEAKFQTSTINSRSILAKQVFRHSLTFKGKVSREGLDAMQHLLWAKLGRADKDTNTLEEALPGVSMLVHARGERVFRVVEVAGKTHLAMDHRRWSVSQFFEAFIGIPAFVEFAMFAGDVHHDWMEMFGAISAMVVLTLGPLAYFHRRHQESKSAAIFKGVTDLAREYLPSEYV